MQTPDLPSPPRLIDIRNARGLSQQDVATALGTTHVNVSRWERGLVRPRPDFRRKLCEFFAITEDELDLALLQMAQEGEPDGEGWSALHRPPQGSLRGQLADEMDTPSPPDVYDPAIPLPPAIQLVGREQDLTQIKQRLFSGGNVALTALNGLPGVGKTALAIDLAHDPAVRAHFRDGILWAGLGPSPNLPGLLSRWGSLLGISTTQMASLGNNEAWAKALRDAIGSRTMLLIIDDAWTLEEALAFRVGGPNCAHLLTTRFPAIAAHVAVGGATTIRELGEEESIALLQQLAPQVISHEAQKVHDLVHAMGGLPLALTLMGNYLRKQTYNRPTRRISTTLERLSDAEVRLHIDEPRILAESYLNLASETPLSLQSVIAVTDQLLSEPARAALYTLAIFPPKPNSFAEEVALVVAACTTDELDELNDAGLLETNGFDRYYLHQVISDYARLALTSQSAASAHKRLLAYVADYVETHKKDYEQLELESSTILAALDIAYNQHKEPALIRIATAFAPFLILRGFYTEAEQHLSRAHQAAFALNDEDCITAALLYKGEVALKRGDFPQAEAYFQEGLTLARHLGKQERICDLLNDLGWMTLKRGDFPLAESYLQEGLSLARELGDRERICAFLKILGSLESNQGNFSRAEVYLREGLMLAQQIGDREQLFMLLINLGAASGERGNFVQAESYFQEGLVLARQIGHREGISVLLANLGDTASELGKYAEAEAYFREGLLIARQIGHREWISALLVNLSIMMRTQGRYKQAEDALKESLTLARQISRPQIVANALYEYGILQLEQKQVRDAEATFREMLMALPEGDQGLLALARYGLSRALAIQDKLDDARQLAEESVVTLEKISHRKAGEVRAWLATLQG